MAVLNYTKIMHEEIEDDNPSTYIGGSARRRLKMIQREIDRRYREGRR